MGSPARAPARTHRASVGAPGHGRVTGEPARAATELRPPDQTGNRLGTQDAAARAASSLAGRGAPPCPTTLWRLRPPPLPGPPLTPAAPFPPSRPSRARQRKSAESLESVGTAYPAGAHAARGERHRKQALWSPPGTLLSLILGFGVCPPFWARGINPGAPGSPAGFRAAGADPPACDVKTLCAGRHLLRSGTHQPPLTLRIPANPGDGERPERDRTSCAQWVLLSPAEAVPGAAPALPLKAVLETELWDDATDLRRLMAAHPGPSRRAPRRVRRERALLSPGPTPPPPPPRRARAQPGLVSSAKLGQQLPGSPSRPPLRSPSLSFLSQNLEVGGREELGQALCCPPALTDCRGAGLGKGFLGRSVGSPPQHFNKSLQKARAQTPF